MMATYTSCRMCFAHATLSAIFLAGLYASVSMAEQSVAIEKFGKIVFLDRRLSVNANRSCSSCHDPENGYRGVVQGVKSVSGIPEGSTKKFGSRRAPGIGYIFKSPILHHRIVEGRPVFFGGAFSDGRATGLESGNALEDQVLRPFTDPSEMGLPHEHCVVHLICNGDDSGDFTNAFHDAWGENVCTTPILPEMTDACANAETQQQFFEENSHPSVQHDLKLISLSLRAFLTSDEVNPFDSDYDRFRNRAIELSSEERAGFELFSGKANCSKCHSISVDDPRESPLFTNYSFHNTGVPKNGKNPVYNNYEFNPEGRNYVDYGLSRTLEGILYFEEISEMFAGMHRVPTLRNLGARNGRVRYYTHNGYFSDLGAIVRFYNTRDVWPSCEDEFADSETAIRMKCWPLPEVAQNRETELIGNLGLTRSEEQAIVSFLNALSDLR